MTQANDDAEARKDRADAIRRARDERNARISSSEPLPTVEEADAEAAGGDGDGSAPNYVDLIDQQMRRERGDA